MGCIPLPGWKADVHFTFVSVRQADSNIDLKINWEKHNVK